MARASALLLAVFALTFVGGTFEGTRAKANGSEKLGPRLRQRIAELKASGRLETELDVTVRLSFSEDAVPPGTGSAPLRRSEGEGGTLGKEEVEPPSGRSRPRAIGDAVSRFVQWVRKAGFEVTSTRTRAAVVGVRLPAGRVEELARRPEVVSVELEVVMQPQGN